MSSAKKALMIVFIGIISLRTSDAEKPSWEYPAVEMPGWHAEAIAVALREFQKNQGGRNAKGEPVYGDLRHYSVKILTLERGVEVFFVPKHGPKDWKEGTVGGRTQYGIEVSYQISKKLKIVKTSFAR